MIKRCKGILPVLLAGMLLLSGCASLPELSQQERDRVVNYSAGLLLRYSKNSPDKLTYLDPAYTPSYLAEADTIVTPVPETPPEPETPAPQEEEPPAEEPPGDDAGEAQTQETQGNDTENPDATGTEDTGTEPPEEEPEEPQESIDYGELVTLDDSMLQSVVGGLHVEYNGYSIRNAYPDTTAQGAVIAMPGDKLLTVDFRVRNHTDQAVTVNTAHAGPQYKLIINGDVQGFTLVTMIENDLSSLLTTIAPGEVFDTVLLMELPETLAKSVDKLALQIIVGGERQTIELE